MRKIMCKLGLHKYHWNYKTMSWYCLYCPKEKKCG